MEVHGTFGSIGQYAPGLHSLCASHHWTVSPGDQRKAQTLNVNTGSSTQPRIAGCKVGFAPLALHNLLMQTLPWQKRTGGDFYFLEVTGKCLLDGKVLCSELIVLLSMLPAFA